MAGSSAAVPLGVLPCPPVRKVAVAMALKLVPAVVTAFCVWGVEREHEGSWHRAEVCLANCECSQPTREGAQSEDTVGLNHPFPGATPYPPLLYPSPVTSLLHSHIFFSAAKWRFNWKIITPIPSRPNSDVSFSDLATLWELRKQSQEGLIFPSWEKAPVDISPPKIYKWPTK